MQVKWQTAIIHNSLDSPGFWPAQCENNPFISRITSGEAVEPLKIFHYILTEYSHAVAKIITDMGIELRLKSDLRFIECVYKVRSTVMALYIEISKKWDNFSFIQNVMFWKTSVENWFWPSSLLYRILWQKDVVLLTRMYQWSSENQWEVL